MLAAAMFVEELDAGGRLNTVSELVVDLYGSLALTGLGHNIDRALLLGLEGERPDRIDVETIDRRVAVIRNERELQLHGRHRIPFVEARDLVFHRQELLPHHTNGLRFTARDSTGTTLLSQEYYSIGGGFVVTA